MSKEKITKLYRCEFDWIELEYTKDEFFPLEIGVVFREFEVIKHTKCGYKIIVNGKQKFILQGNGKRFAHETKKKASESLLRRMKKRKEYLERDMRAIDSQIKMAYEFNLKQS